MKMIEKVNDIETSLETSKNFTIKASPKAFKILSSGLYSNKIRAVIRELSCNAYDSHIAAKNDEPFIVHLPSAVDEHFYVKDFGTGLSENDIMNLYTTYFESNKTNSNDFVGALGLGSKSPFSYTDSFIVESIFNHKKITYLIYINEEDLPSISKLEEVDTDEHTGLTVKFSVKTDDLYKFKEEAINILSVFEKQPKLIGSNINEDKNILFDKLNFKNDYCYGGSSTYTCGLNAFMGNILYPIELDKLDLDEHIIKLLTTRNLIIKFNIGELDITPSREHLSYIKSTINKLETKIKEVTENIIEDSSAIVNSSEDTVQMIKRFNNLEEYIRFLVYNKIDRTKFIFDDILYYKPTNIFYLNTSDIDEKNISIEGVRFFRFYDVDYRAKSHVPYLCKCSTNFINLLNEYHSFYVSFNTKSDKRYKFNNPSGSTLISIRKTKDCQLSNKQIIDIIKTKFLIKEINDGNCLDDIDEDSYNKEKVIKYARDMAEGNIGVVLKWIDNYGYLKRFNSENNLYTVDSLKNDNKTFYIPVDNKFILDSNKQRLSSDLYSYYKFVVTTFRYLYSKQKIKIIFCRNKAIDYVKNFGITNFFDYAIRCIRKNKKAIKKISDYYNEQNTQTDNIVCKHISEMEKISKYLPRDDFANIKDNILKNTLINVREKINNKGECQICNFNKGYIEKIFNIKISEIKTESINLSIYDDIFSICSDMWNSNVRSSSNNIINLFNTVYNYNTMRKE